MPYVVLKLIESSAYVYALRREVEPKKQTFCKLASLSDPPSCTERPTATKFSASLTSSGP